MKMLMRGDAGKSLRSGGGGGGGMGVKVHF